MKPDLDRPAIERRLARKLAVVADRARPWPARKSAARYAANLAEKLGLIERPDRCEWCVHRLPLERHHPDHSQPLAVNWLCRPCHDIADASAAVTQSAASTP